MHTVSFHEIDFEWSAHGILFSSVQAKSTGYLLVNSVQVKKTRSFDYHENSQGMVTA